MCAACEEEAFYRAYLAHMEKKAEGATEAKPLAAGEGGTPSRRFATTRRNVPALETSGKQ